MRASRQARDAGELAAGEAARAALLAAGAPYLHPIAEATQIQHILGPAAHAARAFELQADDISVGADYIRRVQTVADQQVTDVLRRFPGAPGGGGRPGQLLRDLDALLR